jgi:HD-GYP domain-containing protein (c-di-GMP phosphodiesterase class II)
MIMISHRLSNITDVDKIFVPKMVKLLKLVAMKSYVKMRGFEKNAVNRIKVAGRLHDIGKIGIDEKILNKNVKMENNEWEIMRMHPAKGAKILENTAEYNDLAGIVFSHHEYYTGGRYTNEIKDGDIPLESRIITIADAYDAMTVERTYRKAMTKKAAVNELMRCSGTQFDSYIVDIFVNEVVPDVNLIV